MSNEYLRTRARTDFDDALKKARMQEIFSKIRGKSNQLLSFDVVQDQFKGLQGSSDRREEIQLDAIVGSVGRYNDFNRDFLPLGEHDRERWANVKLAMESDRGVPPINVYQVGDIYFVIDGNHRVSIAKQRGDTSIEAFVTEIRTHVDLAATDSPEDIIRKAEFNDFLAQTRLNVHAPDISLQTTEAGQHPKILNQIGRIQSEQADTSDLALDFTQAAAIWYEEYYQPTVDVIREQNLLRYYPDRTETDLYMWLVINHEKLTEDLGWDLQLESVAMELARREQAANQLVEKIMTAVDPNKKTGEWRSKQFSTVRGRMFADICVLLSSDLQSDPAAFHAINIAGQEDAHLLGLFLQSDASGREENPEDLRVDFNARCKAAGIDGQLATGKGARKDVLRARSRWTDLIVLPAPEQTSEVDKDFHELLEQIHIPVWIAREKALADRPILLSFDGSPKSQEGLFISAYLASLWGYDLVVHTSLEPGVPENTQDAARVYLESYGVEARYSQSEQAPSDAVMDLASETDAGLVITGSYHAHRLGRHEYGKTLDQLIRRSTISLLVCR